jgi:hypothetical protein
MMRSGLLLGVALALTTVTAAPAQELTPYQSQVLGGIKKTLVEYTQKQHANCDSTSKRVCAIGRVDVLDTVLKGWENTPGYGKYALNVMDWHVKRSIAIATVADDYVAQHGRPDAGLEVEVRRKITANRLLTRQRNTRAGTCSARRTCTEAKGPANRCNLASGWTGLPIVCSCRAVPNPQRSPSRRACPAITQRTIGSRTRNENFGTGDQGSKLPHFREQRPGSV